MTVNTLGSHEPVRSSRTVAEWLWPFLPMAIAAFFLSSLLYYHTHYASMAVRTPLQVLVAEVYRIFGLAPSFLFFLLVGTWSSIWLYTGQLDRPLARLGRLAAMAVMLGVFLNLGDGGVAPAVQKGELGAWFAGQLVGAIGYFFSLVIVLLVTIASMLLATDFFFSEGFDRLLRSRPKQLGEEAGVESAVTDHLRTLGTLPKEPAREPGSAETLPRGREPVPSAAASADAASAATAFAPPVAARAEVPAEVDEPAPDPEADPEAGAGAGAAEAGSGRRSSYFDRRRERLERARARAAELAAEAAPEQAAPEQVAPEQVVAVEPWVPAPESQEIDNPESTVDDVVTAAAAADDDLDLAGLVDEAGDEGVAQPWDAVAEADEVGEEAGEHGAAGAAPPARMGAPAAGAGPVVPVAAASDADDAPFVVSDEDDADDDLAELAADARDREPDEPAVILRAAPAATAPVDDDEPEAAVDPSADESAPAFGERPVPIPRPETPPPFVAHEPPVSRPAPAANNRQGNLFQGSDEGLVQEAIELVTGSGRATAALLQRKLRVDYQEALGLLAALAARGVIALEGDATHGRVLS